MRAILFCNEMLGLGHLRLSLALASAMVERDQRSTALVVTGSPAYGGVGIPPGVDILKIPTAPVSADSRWSATGLRPSAGLKLDEDRVRELRCELALTTVKRLRPDVAVVDYRPLGRGGELRPTLEWLREEGSCTTALGLWEVDDAAERLRSVWNADVLGAVGKLYDLALVYGAPAAGDVRVEGLRAAGVPVHETGLVGMRPAGRGPADLGDGYLLATAGGGVDGFALLDCLLSAIRLRPLDVPVVLVSGPMMGGEELARLREHAAGLDAHVTDFRSDMSAVLAGALAVVSMAGYSTVAEVLGAGKPTLLVPRSFPRVEQLNRARRLAVPGRVEMLDPERLEPAGLRQAMGQLLEMPAFDRDPLTGAGDVVRILEYARRGRLA